MRKPKRYRFNPRTLSYEPDKVSAATRFGRGLGVFVLSLLFLLLFMWFMTYVFHADLPKTWILRMNNASWQSKLDILDRRMDVCRVSLEDMAERDDEVYRSLFGLGEIPEAVRNAGISGISRYDELREANPSLALFAARVDTLLKMAVVQSRSYDEVESVALRAGEIAQCIPAICPLSTEPGNFRYTSSFGYRRDPVYGTRGDRHTGIDLACNPGTPVFATADGKVVMAQKYYGYGNLLEIDHGFGYHTRYGHLLGFNVKAGDIVRRGDCVAFSGNSGKSTGPHLHYEVLYRGTPVNPLGFLDLEMVPEDYLSIVRMPATRPKTGGRRR